MGHVVCVCETENSYKCLAGSLKGRDNLEDLRVDYGTILIHLSHLLDADDRRNHVSVQNWI
jgi:hypothetical protein